MWKKIGLGAALIAAFVAPAALHGVGATPGPQASLTAQPAKQAASKSFVPVCKADEVVDTRPDPVWVGSSFAHDNCWAPKMPALMDGYSATREEIVAGMNVTDRYMASADAYQRCISDFLAAQKARSAKAGKPVNAMLITIENHRIAASQENKKKADALIKVAINAFNELGSECPE